MCRNYIFYNYLRTVNIYKRNDYQAETKSFVCVIWRVNRERILVVH